MTDSLFDEPAERSSSASPSTAGTPLAERMRPRTLDEMIGQEHILAPGRPLRDAIERDLLQSIILWGPPGTGKTTLARIVAEMTKAHFVQFSAVLAGIKEIKEFCRTEAAGLEILRSAVQSQHLSARAYHRVLKLARTIADLFGVEEISASHIAEALMFRPKTEI